MGCYLPYTQFEQNSLFGAPENFWEFPIFIRESRKILGNSENFGNSSNKKNCVITDLGTTSCILSVISLWQKEDVALSD